jgi:hypothetical protein
MEDQLAPEDVEEFKRLVREETGHELSTQEARDRAIELITLVRILVRPDSENEAEAVTAVPAPVSLPDQSFSARVEPTHLPPMTQLSQEYFDEAIINLASKKDLQEFRREVNEKFGQVDIKLDAVMELLAHRREFENLVRELKAHGIKLDESKIFVS